MTARKNPIVAKYHGKVLGQVRIKKPVEYTEQYECAAWWEQRESELGIFDLRLVEHHLYPHDIWLEAQLPAHIVSNYFQSLWGGVAFGEPYDTKKDAGKPCQPVRFRLEIPKAVSKTGNTPDAKDFDVYLPPELWREFIDYYRAELDGFIESVRRCTNEFLSEGDGESHRSNLTQLGWSCGQVQRLTKIIDEMERRLGYLQEASPMWRNLLEQNSAWAREEKAA